MVSFHWESQDLKVKWGFKEQDGGSLDSRLRVLSRAGYGRSFVLNKLIPHLKVRNWPFYYVSTSSFCKFDESAST